MGYRLYSWKFPLLVATICLLLWSMATVLLRTPTPESNEPNDSNEPTVGVSHLNSDSIMDYFAKSFKRNAKLDSLKTKSSIYKDIFSDMNMYDFLSKNLFQDRCKIYFNHLSVNDPDWMVNPDRGFVFNREAYKHFDSYRDEKLKDIQNKINEAKEKGERYDPPSDDEIRQEYEDLRKAVLNDEQTLHDYIAHVRIFEKCFMGASDGADRKDVSFAKTQRNFLKKSITYLRTSADKASGQLFTNKIDPGSVEQKLFPWLTKKLPVFTRWDGKRFDFPGSTMRFPHKKSSFLNEYKSRLNGKGIVLTLGDGHVTDATRFIRLLRYLGNTYPIQVVYHSNLSEESQHNLVRAARDPFEGYPTVDLWFVNADRSIEGKYKEKFTGFANKIMATMFNSFEEMILCDADSVLLENPSYFFKLKKFIDTGSFFYKDRATGYFRPTDDMIFFKKLMPSIEDSAIFNIAQTTDYTLDNEFFHGLADYLESGVVVMDRKRHFMQPLFMSILNFYEPVIKRIYGDKELFWLGLSLGGDEEYGVNDHFAAAIGEFTPDHERHKDIGSIKYMRSKEICSNHPAHISDEDNLTLVWFNSGFRHCGNSFKPDLNWEEEFNKKTRYTRINNIDEFKTFFKSELKITNAIIPPYDRSMLRNIDNEPEKPWNLANYCRGYLWCAYSLIGGYYVEDDVTKDNLKAGHIITFTPEKVKSFEEAAKIWLASFDWEQL